MEVQCYIDQATSVTRAEALKKKDRNTLGNRVPLVVTYHPHLPKLSMILRKHLPILQVSERMKRMISSAPLVAYRRPRNLKDLLVRATLRKPLQPSHEGTRQCGRPRCKTCAHIRMGVRFSSAVTDEDFRARATADCKTSNVVYLIACQKCGKQCWGNGEPPSSKIKWS